MPSPLPIVELQGPLIPPVGRLAGKLRALWLLELAAPLFGTKNVKPKGSENQADKVHSLRVLALDPRPREVSEPPERNPRLLSLHLLAGAEKTGPYADRGFSISFAVRLGGDSDPDPTAVESPDEKGNILLSTQGPRADGKCDYFHHVVGLPQMTEADEWREVDIDGKIPMRPVRLVQGVVPLVVKRSDLPWIGNLPLLPEEDLVDEEKVRLLLTADGIEVHATVPFPKTDGSTERLPGRFLLSHDPTARLKLTLLPERLGPERERWFACWRALSPAPGSRLGGFVVQTRVGGELPSFVWDVVVDKTKILGVSKTVSVPGADILVRMESPPGANGSIDGELTFQPATWVLSPAGDAGALVRIPEKSKELWCKAHQDWADVKKAVTGWSGCTVLTALALPETASQAEKSPTDALAVTVEASGKLTATLRGLTDPAAGHALAHDEVVLAQALRSAHGFAEPRAGSTEPDPILLWGFVPLAEGWLQLPVPNLAPPDPEKDSALISLPAPRPPNVLSGFLRYAEWGNMPEIASASIGTAFSVDRAPWMVTVESAQAVALAIGLGAGKMTQAAVAIVGPELSTRGLLWLSSDRPDALEGLPRLGAGASAFLDVPLESEFEQAAAFAVTLRQFAFVVPASSGGNAVSAERTLLALDLGFNGASETWNEYAGAPTKSRLDAIVEILTGSKNELARPLPPPPVIWCRHPRMPLAAIMPMTRVAGSAVRPLESRDLVPFLARIEKTEDFLRFPRLTWEILEVFPSLAYGGSIPNQHVLLRPVAAWPWPKDDSRGLALAAFGVPGAELVVTQADKPANSPWDQLLHALRFDLPSLDEAFATATLPPAVGTLPPEENEAMATPPLATALDWVLLQNFWQDQDRRHQLARVMHSHLVTGYKPVGATANEKVTDLVRGAEWEVSLGFFLPYAKPLPYGHASIAGADLEGNNALEGYSGTPQLSWPNASHPELKGEVIGFAPPSATKDDLLIDARGNGMRPMEKIGNRFYRRIIVFNSSYGARVELYTLQKAVAVSDWNGKALFEFWFKDVPFDSAGSMESEGASVDWASWQDDRLPKRLLEWRLWPAEPAIAKIVFAEGRDRLPFFGLALEPLYLGGGVIVGQDLASVAIICRMHAGDVVDRPAPAGNLVTLSLVRKGDGLVVDRVVGYTAEGKRQKLRFSFNLGDSNAGQAGWAEALLDLPDQEWSPVLALEEFSVELQDRPVKLKGANLTLAGQAVGQAGFDWKTPVHDAVSTVKAGQGEYRLLSARLTVGLQKDGSPLDPEFRLRRSVLLLPTLTPSEDGPPANCAALEITTTAEAEGNAVVLLDAEFSQDNAEIKIREADEAIACTLKTNLPVLLWGGVAGTGSVSFGLVARVGAFNEQGVASLTAGVFDGEWVESGPGAGRIPFHAECCVRVADQTRLNPVDDTSRSSWQGGLTIHRRLSVASAIAWPRIPDYSTQKIPWPGEDANGRWKLFFAQDQPAVRHQVTYVFDGHCVGFDLAVRMLGNAPDSDAFFCAPVVAQHLFQIGADTVARFVGVETVSLGRPEAVVRLPEPLKGDPVAFAPRYQYKLKPSTAIAPGMIADGFGRAATVFAGATGYALRAACWKEWGDKPPALLITGGFVGLVGEAGGPEFVADLLRIPVLGVLQRGPANPVSISQEAAEIEVAWADSAAALKIVSRLRTAVTPASTCLGALRQAMLAGTSLEPGEYPPGEVEGALLVEQSFSVAMDDPPAAGSLDQTIFFPAAAVCVAKLLKLAQKSDFHSWTTVSFMAGRGLRLVRDRAKSSVSRKTVGLAASVIAREGLFALRPPLPRPPVMVTVGDDVVIGPWFGPAPSELDGALPAALVAGRLFAEHVWPRAALFAGPGEDGNSLYRFLELPARPRPARAFEPPEKTAHPSSARGYAWAPGEEPDGWLRGVEEGVMTPFRENKPASSGLAGLARRVAFPAQATANRFRWIAQARMPVFRPLGLANVSAPPIPWLSPGRVRPRVPTEETINKVLAKILNGAPPPGSIQSFIPEEATIATVGDRPGILLARTMRIETAIPEITCFDEFNPAFGRPADAGTNSLRVERTPRPGPLPPNKDKGDPLRDRRVMASPVLPQTALALLRGSADTVGSGPDLTGDSEVWTATFVVAADWDGLLPENTDGSVALDVELDVKAVNPPAKSPADYLSHVLLQATGDKSQLTNTAVLVIGETIIPFRRMRLLQTKPFSKLGSEASVYRAALRLALEAGEETEPAVFPVIAAALRAEVASPAVEVRLGVYPSSGGTTDLEAKDVVSLAPVSATPGIPSGSIRPPVTLRLRLIPVVRSRGVLPIPLNTLLFSDASYNLGLSSAPAMDRALVQPRFAVGVTDPSSGRGDIVGTLFADRSKVNRKGSVVFMVDLAFERPLEGPARRTADPEVVDGDLLKVSIKGGFGMRVAVVTRRGERRALSFGGNSGEPQVRLAIVYELPLGMLAEADGQPAKLVAGDMLELEVSERSVAMDQKVNDGPKKVVNADRVQCQLWVDGARALELTGLTKTDGDNQDPMVAADVPFTRTLRILLTDEPVVEPPPALYAALVLRKTAEELDQLSLPLYAQSPLPWRVDLPDAKANFREGMMQRTATFVWNLARPKSELTDLRAYVVKMDRNGQAYFPKDRAEFVSPRVIASSADPVTHEE